LLNNNILDALVSSRDGKSNGVQEKVLSTLLNEMDGISGSGGEGGPSKSNDKTSIHMSGEVIEEEEQKLKSSEVSAHISLMQFLQHALFLIAKGKISSSFVNNISNELNNICGHSYLATY
jgi:SpoVK/Ycf46/Vps4 family AAA+-type ATPase